VDHVTAILLLAAGASLATTGTALVTRWSSVPGRLSQVCAAAYRVAYGAWWVSFAITAQVGTVGRILLGVWVVVTLSGLPWQVLDDYLHAGALYPGPRPAVPAARADGPFVSVHVCCYAEPPAVVCRTLDALARLRYSDFEVLVVDNNTEDEALWWPVREHCERLGARFRFFHVRPLAGAKAGALNFALRHTDPAAALIAVLDCDYVASADFLGSLVGYFADERIAFVQTAHDYRLPPPTGYLRACYGEYRLPYATYLVGRDTWRAPLVVGTMCVLRRTALTRVGGWSTRCLTEDSELAIRLHAAGYAGRYLPVTFGRGVMPETFAAYRKQRSRWIGGPVQELRRHWRLYLSGGSRLTAAQRILFAHHGLREVGAGLRLALVGMVAFAAWFPDVPRLSVAAVGALAVGALPAALVRWASSSAGSVAAAASLSFARGVAALRSLSGSARPWGRTAKFPVDAQRWIGAVWPVRAELAAATGAAVAAGTVIGRWPPTAFAVLVAGYLLYHAVTWLAAPAMALWAERDLRRAAAEPGTGTSPRPTAAASR
jgi:hypothetical protein